MEELKKAKKKIGMKECIKAVKNGNAKVAYIANDAEERIIKPFVELCNEKAVEIIYIDTMDNLGKTCGIQVGAATVVVIN